MVKEEQHIGRAAWTGLGILTLVNLFNYLDRYMVSALVESLGEDPTMRLTDTQAGTLMTGFVVVFTLASPIFGSLGDKGRRVPLVAAGVALWSVASATGGLVTGFLALFLARAAVGIGEAAYGTIAPAMLADYFPARLRGRIFSVFYCAIPVGAASGYIIGGLLDAAYGWRAAFFFSGSVGLLLSLAVLRIKDPERGAQDDGPSRTTEALPVWTVYKRLLQNRPFRLSILGYAAYTFAVGGLAFWAPTFLERVRGATRSEATVTFGAIIVVTGFLGTAVGGLLADKLRQRMDSAYLWVSAVSTLISVPFVIVALSAPAKMVYMPAMAVAQLFLFMSTGPINSAIVGLVEPGRRATAVALSVLVMHMLGDVPSPPLIGAISDSSSLQLGVMLVPVAVLVAGLIWLRAAMTSGATKEKSPSVS